MNISFDPDDLLINGIKRFDVEKTPVIKKKLAYIHLVPARAISCLFIMNGPGLLPAKLMLFEKSVFVRSY